MPKEQFRREVENELTGKETEPWEIIYFKLYKSQIPVIEQALETAALMLGSDRSRGYCLEMICADFLAGANLDNGDPDVLARANHVPQVSVSRSATSLSHIPQSGLRRKATGNFASRYCDAMAGAASYAVP
jgi:hypothetical protein